MVGGCRSGLSTGTDRRTPVAHKKVSGIFPSFRMTRQRCPTHARQEQLELVEPVFAECAPRRNGLNATGKHCCLPDEQSRSASACLHLADLCVAFFATRSRAASICRKRPCCSLAGGCICGRALCIAPHKRQVLPASAIDFFPFRSTFSAAWRTSAPDCWWDVPVPPWWRPVRLHRRGRVP